MRAKISTGISEIDAQCVCQADYYEAYRCVANKLESLIREILEKERTNTIMFSSRAPNDDYSYEIWIFNGDKVKYIHSGYATARGRYYYEYSAKSLADVRIYGRLPDLSKLASWVRYKLGREFVLTVCSNEG